MHHIQVSITKTPEEWLAIQERMGKKDLPSYIRAAASALKSRYLENPECMVCSTNDSVRKRPRIDQNTQESLEFLAFHLQKPVDQIVNELIILPLLLPQT